MCVHIRTCIYNRSLGRNSQKSQLSIQFTRQHDHKAVFSEIYLAITVILCVCVCVCLCVCIHMYICTYKAPSQKYSQSQLSIIFTAQHDHRAVFSEIYLAITVIVCNEKSLDLPIRFTTQHDQLCSRNSQKVSSLLNLPDTIGYSIYYTTYPLIGRCESKSCHTYE